MQKNHYIAKAKAEKLIIKVILVVILVVLGAVAFFAASEKRLMMVSCFTILFLLVILFFYELCSYKKSVARLSKKAEGSIKCLQKALLIIAILFMLLSLLLFMTLVIFTSVGIEPIEGRDTIGYILSYALLFACQMCFFLRVHLGENN